MSAIKSYPPVSQLLIGGGSVVEVGGGRLSFELCAQLGRHAGSVEAVDSVQPHFLFQSRSLKTAWFSGGGQ